MGFIRSVKIFVLVFIFIFPFVVSAFDLNEFAVSYTDIDKYNEYLAPIDYFTDKKVVSGYSDGTFKSDDYVNRAEALKMILESSGIDVVDDIDATSDITYNDVNPNDWYAPYVLQATNLNIVQGYSDGSFKPSNFVNLSEVLKMVFFTNGIRDLPLPLYAPAEDVDMEQWYSDEFAFAIENDIAWPDKDYYIYPGSFVSRGELLDILYKFFLRDDKQSIVYRGFSTYYSDYFNGHNTSSGEVYDSTALTAAHRFLPFGTQIEVTNIDNGKSIIVKVNDRGPFSNVYTLDLSSAAFAQIGQLSSGNMNVFYRILN